MIPAARLLTCRYSLGGRDFAEQITFDPGGRTGTRRAYGQAARLVCLLAGVSYYKTAAPPVIDLGETAVTATERDFLRGFYLDGLGEFAYRNGLDLSGLRVRGPGQRRAGRRRDRPRRPAAARAPAHPLRRRHRLDRHRGDGPRPGRRGAVHHEPARRPVRRDRAPRPRSPGCRSSGPAARSTRSCCGRRELGFLNGHVPVTGILSAIAVMAAVLDGRDAVVMSNEWSASVATLQADGRPVNHQYSKSVAFEAGFREVLAGALGGSARLLLRAPPVHRAVGGAEVRRADPVPRHRSAAATAPSTSTRRTRSTTGAAGATSAASST